LHEVKDAVSEKQKTLLEKPNKTTKIILKNHDIEHTDINSLNKNNIENFKIKKAKNSLYNKSLILHIDFDDLQKAMDLKNWKNINKNFNLLTDKYDKNFSTLCLNQIQINQNNILSLEQVEEGVKEQYSGASIFNVRYNQNKTLIIFEITKETEEKLTNKILKKENKIFNIRHYDPVDNYIIRCSKCHKFGHLKSECTSKKQICIRCSDTTCERKCTKLKCPNCNGNHSGNYKGCPEYKKIALKAKEIKSKKHHETEIKEIKINNLKMNKNIDNLNKTYADIAKNKNIDLDPLNSKIVELENSLNKINNELRSLSSQLFQYKEALKYAYTNHNQLCLTLYRILHKSKKNQDDKFLRKTITESIKMNCGSSCFGERNMESEMEKIFKNSQQTTTNNV